MSWRAWSEPVIHRTSVLAHPSATFPHFHLDATECPRWALRRPCEAVPNAQPPLSEKNGDNAQTGCPGPPVGGIHRSHMATCRQAVVTKLSISASDVSRTKLR
jgi:hypothetical protein